MMAGTPYIRCAIAAALAAGSLGAPGRAEDFTWVGGSGNWDDPAHWAGGAAPQGLPTDRLFFPTAYDVVTTVTAAHNPWIVNGLEFTHPRFAISNTQGIQFDGTAPFIRRAPGARAIDQYPVSGPVVLAQTTTYSDVSTDIYQYYHPSQAMTFTGSISGPGGLLVESGAVALNQSNWFAGGLTIRGSSFTSAGTVNGSAQFYGSFVAIKNSQAIGTGTLVLDGRGKYATLGLQFDDSATFNNNVVVTGGLNRLITGFDLISTPNRSVAFNKLTFGPGDSWLEAGNQTGWDSSLSFKSTELQGNARLTLHYGTRLNLGPVSETGGSFGLTLDVYTGSPATLTLGIPSTYSGGTIINPDVYVRALSIDAMGTGPVLLTGGSLWLGAASGARNTITGDLKSNVSYQANGAAGGHLVTSGRLEFGSSVKTFSSGTGSDTFATTPDGTVTGDSAVLALLDRGTNFFPGPRTAIFNTNGPLPTVKNLGAAADLLLGVHTALNSDVVLGAGTPYRGMAGPAPYGRSTYTGTVTAESDLSFSNLQLGTATAGSFRIAPGAGAAPVNVALKDVHLLLASPDFSGVNTFTLSGTIYLGASAAFGGGGASTPRPAVVTGADLQIYNPAALNGNVLFQGGSLTLATSPLTGTGTLTRDNQPITFDFRSNPRALTGSQLVPEFIRAGDTVKIEASDFVALGKLDPAANIVFSRASSQSDPLNTNGGSVRVLGTVSPSREADFHFNVGPAGATFLGRPLRARDVLEIDSAVAAPVRATGPVRFAEGGLALSNRGNVLPAIEILPGTQLYCVSPGVVAGTDITVKGGWLILRKGHDSPSEYGNTVHVLGDAILDTQSRASIIYETTAEPRSLAAVNLGNATLSLLTSKDTTINTLRLTGDAALQLDVRSSSNNSITIRDIHEDASSRSLTFLGPSSAYSSYTLAGRVAVTGPVHVRGAVIVNGTIDAAPEPVLVETNGTLMGRGTIHRAVRFEPNSSGWLSPGIDTWSATPRTLTVDALVLDPSTSLNWTLDRVAPDGSSISSLVVVNGDLVLDGILNLPPKYPVAPFTPGIYTLFTYGGALTDNGLVIDPKYHAFLDLSTPGKVNLAVGMPEPLSLGMLAPAFLLILRRRR